MSFNKSKRNCFIQHFKQEVRERNSIDKLRISQINDSHYKIFHSQSPSKLFQSQSPSKKQNLSSTQFPDCLSTNLRGSVNQSNQKTAKVKIKLLSPQQYQKTTARNSVKV